MMIESVLGGLFGMCIGDALGVPVEFVSREDLRKNPVKTMVGYGTHNQPLGTWSDDSSLAFCLAESLCDGYSLEDLAKRIVWWYDKGYWTPYGEVFDIGNATLQAIRRLKRGSKPQDAGGKTEYDNGNGSLMRILPLAYYLEKANDANDKFQTIHDVSAVTHAHPRAMMACAIFVEVALNLLKGAEPIEAYNMAKKEIVEYYTNHNYAGELASFARVLYGDVSKLMEAEIKSSGYVVDTIEASLWCFLTSNNYEEAVLKAVNLGDDSDTTAAVTGGLAGLYFKINQIPKEWIEKTARKDDIFNLAYRLNLVEG